MFGKRGISLIVLIITIVVIIVLATAIIVNLSNTNIIKNAENAALENNIAAVQEALKLKLSEITLEEKEVPVMYTDETFETKVTDRVCINLEDETIGKAYYKTSNKEFCIVFGKKENAKENNVIEVATNENVAIDVIEYIYTNQKLPTYKGKEIKWYITYDNKVEAEVEKESPIENIVKIKITPSTGWVKKVDVELYYNGVIEEGYVMQYAFGESEWNDYTNVLEINENTLIKARLYNVTIDEEKAVNSKNISNIDCEAPSRPTELTISQNGTKITVNASGSKDNAFTEVTYLYSIDGESWQNEGYFEGLIKDTEYIVYAKAIDGLGNESEYITKGFTCIVPDIYVSTTGNDETGDGSIEAPYATLAKAIDVAEDGNKIYIAAGEYTLSNIAFDSTGDLGIYDKNKKLEIYGENEKTILTYDGSTSTKRDGCAITLSNSESIVRNLTYVFYPKSGSNYSRAIFRFSKGTVENVFFRISGTNKASYLYYNEQSSSNANNVINCTFYHDLESVDTNYSGFCNFNNIATNVTTKGTNTNVITKSFGTGPSNCIYQLINESYEDQDFITSQVGVFFGENAWPEFNKKLYSYPTVSMNFIQSPYTLTSSGIKNDGKNMVTITGNNSDAIGILYKINDDEWQEYKGTFNVEYGDKIYAKYRFNDTLALAYSEIYIPKYEDIILNDAAYDNDMDSNMIVHYGNNGVTSSGDNYLYLKVDESVIGKTFNIKWYCWDYSGYIARIHVLNKDMNIIQENAATVSGGNTEIDSFTIPEGAEYLKFHFHCSNADWSTNYRIYEMYISD